MGPFRNRRSCCQWYDAPMVLKKMSYGILISALAILIVGCVTEQRTPDVEATVEAVLEEKRIESLPTALSTKDRMGEIKAKSFPTVTPTPRPGATIQNPLLASTATPIPPTPTPIPPTFKEILDSSLDPIRDLQPIKCSDIKGMKSASTTQQEVDLEFRMLDNTGNYPLEIFWKDFQGKEVQYDSVAPGTSLTISTYTEHPWVLRGTNGDCVTGFIVEKSDVSRNPGRLSAIINLSSLEKTLNLPTPTPTPLLESNLKVFSHPDEVIKALDKHNIVNCQTRDTVAGGGNTRKGGIEQEYLEFYNNEYVAVSVPTLLCALESERDAVVATYGPETRGPWIQISTFDDIEQAGIYKNSYYYQEDSLLHSNVLIEISAVTFDESSYPVGVYLPADSIVEDLKDGSDRASEAVSFKRTFMNTDEVIKALDKHPVKKRSGEYDCYDNHAGGLWVGWDDENPFDSVSNLATQTVDCRLDLSEAQQTALGTYSYGGQMRPHSGLYQRIQISIYYDESQMDLYRNTCENDANCLDVTTYFHDNAMIKIYSNDPTNKVITFPMETIMEDLLDDKAPVLATPIPVIVGEGAQRYGGILKYAAVDFGAMDPAIMGLSEGSAMYSNLTYDNLTEPWYDGSIVNRLAEEWSANEDMSVYTINVRDGVTFHDGSPLTSADVKFSFDRILDEATGSPLLGEIDYISEISAPDDDTVVFTLKGSNFNMPRDLSDYHARIVPNGITQERLQYSSADFGTGPYTLGDHNPSDRTRMIKYEDYWVEGKPFYDQIIFEYIPEEATRIEALKSGVVDVIRTFSLAQIEGQNSHNSVTVTGVDSATVRNLVMDTREGSIFHDKNARKAIQYAIDRDFVRKAVTYGFGANANDHPIGRSDPMYWAGQPIINQDIELSRSYLEAAGYHASNPLEVELDASDFSNMLDMALAVEQSIEATDLPIEISVEKHEESTFWEAVWMQPGGSPMVTSAWNGRPAARAVSLALQGGGSWNESYFYSPRMDELLELSSTELDYDARKAYWKEIQEILIEEVPSVYLLYAPNLVAHRSHVKGVQAHPNNWVFMEDWWSDH